MGKWTSRHLFSYGGLGIYTTSSDIWKFSQNYTSFLKKEMLPIFSRKSVITGWLLSGIWKHDPISKAWQKICSLSFIPAFSLKFIFYHSPQSETGQFLNPKCVLSCYSAEIILYRERLFSVIHTGFLNCSLTCRITGIVSSNFLVMLSAFISCIPSIAPN